MARSSTAIQRDILALATQLEDGEISRGAYQRRLNELNSESKVGLTARPPRRTPPEPVIASRTAARIAEDLQGLEKAHRSGVLPVAAYEPARAALLAELKAATAPAPRPPEPTQTPTEPVIEGGKLITCLTCGFTADVAVGDGDETYLCPGCGINVEIPSELRVVGPKALLAGASGVLFILIFLAGQWGDYAERRDAARAFPHITTGWTFEHVKNGMGEPSYTQHNEVFMGPGVGMHVTDCWYWVDATYQVCFLNGRVESKAHN